LAGKVARKGFDVPARQLGRATVIAFGVVNGGQARVHLGLEWEIVQREGDGERPLTEAECAIEVPGEKKK